MRRSAVESVFDVVLRCNQVRVLCIMIVQTSLPSITVLFLQSVLLSALCSRPSLVEPSVEPVGECHRHCHVPTEGYDQW